MLRNSMTKFYETLGHYYSNYFAKRTQRLIDKLIEVEVKID